MVIRHRRFDDVFQALADPTRRGMLTVLARGEATAGELGAPFRISQPAASKHIRVLERAGLVRRRVDGREHRLRLVPRPLRDAEAWIARHRQLWEASLDSLGRTLDELMKEDQP
jgi:DNA-binding transcriptional ArsR family regulator